MTANKDLKRIIRQRMRRTGESYTAARRHFLDPEDSRMTKKHTSDPFLDRPIEHLELTRRTIRSLKNQGIERIGQLVEKAAAGFEPSGFERPESAIEIREVLATRGPH